MDRAEVDNCGDIDASGREAVAFLEDGLLVPLASQEHCISDPTAAAAPGEPRRQTHDEPLGIQSQPAQIQLPKLSDEERQKCWDEARQRR